MAKRTFMAIAAALALATGPVAAQNSISGQTRVIDGDTIEIHGLRIRLQGIDTPERYQRCRDARGREYRCGDTATAALPPRHRFKFRPVRSGSAARPLGPGHWHLLQLGRPGAQPLAGARGLRPGVPEILAALCRRRAERPSRAPRPARRPLHRPVGLAARETIGEQAMTKDRCILFGIFDLASVILECLALQNAPVVPGRDIPGRLPRPCRTCRITARNAGNCGRSTKRATKPGSFCTGWQGIGILCETAGRRSIFVSVCPTTKEI